MPTYEYECRACHRHFEQFQKMSDPTVRKCPYCKKSAVRRLMSGGAGLIFKGTGFYITDYKNKHISTEPGSGKKSGESKKSEEKKAVKSETHAAPAVKEKK